MPLAAAVVRFLATKPDSGSPEESVATRRAAIRVGSDRLFELFGEHPPNSPDPSDNVVAYERGTFHVRVYRPACTAVLPIHVFVHGGGFWLGSVQEKVVDAECRQRSVGAECMVVSVGYRLAPEHGFPTAVEDCVAAVLWASEHGPRFGGAADNLSIGGVSAGANLAAATTLALRDRRGPRLRLQLLEVPVLDLTLETMCRSGVGDDYGITVAEMSSCASMYLPNAATGRDPLASPLRAGELHDLPPARILTAEFDPLRDDGARYAQRLEAAGVPVIHSRQSGAVHGSLMLTGSWPPARAWRAEVLDALRSAHAGQLA